MIEEKTFFNKGITLLALVITIIILLILTGVMMATLAGEGGILNKAKTAQNENEEKTATEIINLKITNVQLQSYEEEEKMPNLQYLADRLYEDHEIQYVYNESKKIANIEKEKIVVTGETIFTKLVDYPYEFEIDGFLRLASINGIKVVQKDENVVTISKEEYENLKSENARLTEENTNLKQNHTKLLGTFASWKKAANWNVAGLSGNVCYDEKMCEVGNNEVKIKEDRKIFDFYAFL